MIMSLYEMSPIKDEPRGVQGLVCEAASERLDDVDTTAPFGLLTAVRMYGWLMCTYMHMNL